MSDEKQLVTIVSKAAVAFADGQAIASRAAGYLNLPILGNTACGAFSV